MDVVLEVHDQPPRLQRAAYEAELTRQQYYQGRNAQASKSHRKQRRTRLLQLGIDLDRIKSVNVKPPE